MKMKNLKVYFTLFVSILLFSTWGNSQELKIEETRSLKAEKQVEINPQVTDMDQPKLHDQKNGGVMSRSKSTPLVLPIKPALRTKDQPLSGPKVKKEVSSAINGKSSTSTQAVISQDETKALSEDRISNKPVVKNEVSNALIGNTNSKTTPTPRSFEGFENSSNSKAAPAVIEGAIPGFKSDASSTSKRSAKPVPTNVATDNTLVPTGTEGSPKATNTEYHGLKSLNAVNTQSNNRYNVNTSVYLDKNEPIDLNDAKILAELKQSNITLYTEYLKERKTIATVQNKVMSNTFKNEMERIKYVQILDSFKKKYNF